MTRPTERQVQLLPGNLAIGLAESGRDLCEGWAPRWSRPATGADSQQDEHSHGKQPRKEGSELRKKELQGVGAEACGTPDSVRQGRSPE